MKKNKTLLVAGNAGSYRWKIKRKTFLSITISYTVYVTKDGSMFPEENSQNRIGSRRDLYKALEFLRENLIKRKVPYDQLPDPSKFLEKPQ